MQLNFLPERSRLRHPAGESTVPGPVMVVFGTRPEAIKVAPVILALQNTRGISPLVVVTNQHREMLDQVLEVFGIVPDEQLGIFRSGQGLHDITARALEGLAPVIAKHQPSAIVVQGDTTTTLAAAMAGFYAQVPVVHMEAGLRTDMRYSPFPEEINRRMTTQLSSVHLAPTALSRHNLLEDGIAPDAVFVTGNTVIDALHWTVGRQLPYGDPLLDTIDEDSRRVLLVTAHRRESWGEGMLAIGRAIAEIARTEPDLLIVIPLHKNPLVRHALVPQIEQYGNVLITEPLAYGGFSRLINRSHLVLTDSGGVQEEAPSLGKPVLVMRETTERPEAVDAGTSRLVGTDADVIVEAVRTLLHDQSAYDAMAHAVNPYGDGFAAERTVQAIQYLLGSAERPADMSFSEVTELAG